MSEPAVTEEMHVPNDRSYKILASGGFLVMIVLEYFAKMLLASYFGPSMFGLYTIGISVYIVATTFILFSSEQSLLKYLSQYRDNLGLQASYLKLSMVLVLSISVLFILLSYTIVDLPWIFKLSPGQESIVYLFLWMSVPFAFLRLVWAKNRATSENKQYFLNRFVYYELGLIGVYLVTITVGLTLKMMVIIQFIFITSLTLALLYKDINLEIILDKGTSIRTVVRSHFQISGHLTFSALIAEVRKRLDIFLIAAFLSKELLGVYAVCLLLSRFPTLIQASFNQFLLPTIVVAKARGNVGLIRDRYSFVQEVNLLFSLPTLMYFMYKPASVLSLFGESYSIDIAQIILTAFAGIHLVMILAGPWGQVLIAESKTSVTSVLSTLAMLICATGLVVLIPRFGVYGALASVGATIIIVNGAAAIYVAVKYKIYPLVKIGLGFFLVYLGLTGLLVYTVSAMIPGQILKILVTLSINFLVGGIILLLISRNNPHRHFLTPAYKSINALGIRI